MKPVVARGEIRIIRRAPRACLSPFVLQAFQYVPESDSFGRSKTEACVVKIYLRGTCRQPNLFVCNDCFFINNDLLDMNRWRQLVGRLRLRVDHHQPSDGRKPQFAFACPPPCGLRSAHALARFHPIRRRERDRTDRACPPCGHLIQLPFADMKDALAAAHPEPSPIILEDSVEGVVKETLTRGVE